MGKVESSYVEGLSSEERRSRFDRLFETGIPVLLLSRNIDVFPECLAAAQEHGVPILRTNEFTSTIMLSLIHIFNASLIGVIASNVIFFFLLYAMAAVTTIPVSYTHLDVYKRQIHHRYAAFRADRQGFRNPGLRCRGCSGGQHLR